MVDSNSLSVIVPSESPKWWASSKISNWRHFVDIAEIKNADPADLTIFDWKIIFEIALRSSTWRLSQSMIFGKTCEVPILGTIQEVDFVTGKALFRLHRDTIAPLLKQHAKYIRSRQKDLPPAQTFQVLQAFERRLDVLQIRLHAGVLDATDGTPGADFPAYASNPAARKSVLAMLNIVLKETGLRKTILDAFVEIKPSVPSFVFDPNRSAGGEAVGSVQSYQSTHTRSITSPPLESPLSELHSLIFKPQPLQQRRFDPNILLPASSVLKRKQTSTRTSSPEPRKRTRTPSRGIKSSTTSQPAIATSSPLITEVKWSDFVSSSSTPREISDRHRSRKSPSACSSTDSGIDTNTPISVSANSPEPNLAKPVHEAKEPDTSITPNESSQKLLSSSNKTTFRIRRVSLNNDELAIYSMDSSFAPVTRQQAARELKKTPNSTSGIGRVRTLRYSASQRSLSSHGSPPRKLQGVEEEEEEGGESSWYDTHEEMELDEDQTNRGSRRVEVEENTEDETFHTAGSTKASPARGANRFGFTLRMPGSAPGQCRQIAWKRNDNKPYDDYTDVEDTILDSDTPTLELLCDSENSDDHRDRKLRRRERKKLKKETLENIEKAKQLDMEIAMLEAELARRTALEALEISEKQIMDID